MSSDDVGLLASQMGKLLVGDEESREAAAEKAEESGKDGEDDGYSSEERSEKSEERSDELEDEEILQPLSFASSSPEPTIQYISRGPIDQESHYNRGHPPNSLT